MYFNFGINNIPIRRGSGTKMEYQELSRKKSDSKIGGLSKKDLEIRSITV